MAHGHPGEKNDYKDSAVIPKEETESKVTIRAIELPKITELPVKFVIDDVVYGLKYDLDEADITPAGISKLQKINHLLIFSMSPNFNIDLEYYIKENDLLTHLSRLDSVPEENVGEENNQ